MFARKMNKCMKEPAPKMKVGFVIASAALLFITGCSKESSSSGVHTAGAGQNASIYSGTYEVQLTIPATGSQLAGQMELDPQGVATITMELQPWFTLRGTVDSAGRIAVTGDTLPDGTQPGHEENWSGQITGTGAQKTVTNGEMISTNAPGQLFPWTAACILNCG